HDGQWVPVDDLSDSGHSATVYNVRIAGYHTYFVGSRDWGFSVWAHNVCMSKDQQALKELVDELSLGGRRPLTSEQAEVILDWANEVGYPGWRAGPADVLPPGNWSGGTHIHLPGAGRAGHVPVGPGVRPRGTNVAAGVNGTSIAHNPNTVQ